MTRIPGTAALAAAIGSLLAAALPAQAADPAHGKRVFEQCAACHGENGVGTEAAPALVGVVGRKAADLEGFRYSAPLKRSGLVWDEATLTAFVADPQGKVKGNRMPFDGVKDQKDLADVVAYLATLKP